MSWRPRKELPLLNVKDGRNERWKSAERRVTTALHQGDQPAKEDLAIVNEEQAAWDAANPETHMTNFERWMEVYQKHLGACVMDPKLKEKFAYGLDKVPEVAKRMGEAFRRGSFNKDGEAIKRTCKEFGVRHTYKDIQAFLAAEPSYEERQSKAEKTLFEDHEPAVLHPSDRRK